MLVLERVVINPADNNLATSRLFLAGQQLEQRRLPRTGRPDQNHKLARLDMNTHPVQGRLVILAICFGNPI